MKNLSDKASSIEEKKTNIKSIQHFDYSILDKNLSDYLLEKTNVIKSLVRRTVQDTLNIGQALIEIKQTLDHGQFMDWLRAEFHWNDRTAEKYMTAARVFKVEDLEGVNISQTALYELSAPSTPEKAKFEALERAKKGEQISKKKATQIRNKYIKAEASADSSLAEKKTQKAQTTSNKQEIIQVISRPSFWQLDRHRIFCADPNSTKIIEQLPSKIALCLAFPPVEHRQFQWQFQSKCHPSIMNFYNKHQDLDHQMLMNSINGIIQITTNEEDNIVVCFIPHPSILSVIHELRCTGFIIEPDYEKCLELVAFR
jgi:hypothetical protein